MWQLVLNEISNASGLILDLTSEATTRGVLYKKLFLEIVYCNIHCYCNIQFTAKQTPVVDY